MVWISCSELAGKLRPWLVPPWPWARLITTRGGPQEEPQDELHDCGPVPGAPERRKRNRRSGEPGPVWSVHAASESAGDKITTGLSAPVIAMSSPGRPGR